MIEYIKSDVYRYCGDFCFLSFIKLFLKYRYFRFQCSLRMCNGKGLSKFFGKVLYALTRRKDIVISYKTKIGYGLYIGHGGPVIINNTAVIGNNCNLSPFVVIGSNNNTAATIGDNVYLGPHVCVVENVEISDNVTIGAGSVVTKNIPKNATAVGNYAKVINYDNPAKYIKNKWNKDTKNHQ